MDTPTIANFRRASNVYDGSMNAAPIGTSIDRSGSISAAAFGLEWGECQERDQQIIGGAYNWAEAALSKMFQQQTQTNMASQRRIVKVYVSDTDPKLPIEKSMLYDGDEKLTDLTDQELFFEINIREALEKHNGERVKCVDKDQSARFGKEVLLEPVKIRDLKMVVVNVATF